MPTALDTFRAQREAAEGVYARLTEVSHLLRDLRGQADALVQNNELRAVLQREQSWLDQAQRTIEEARRWRELEMRRFWPGVWRRWMLALVFALASAAAAGAGYAAGTRPWTAELTALRARTDFADFVEHRVVTMTPGERRQFDLRALHFLEQLPAIVLLRQAEERIHLVPVAPGEHAKLF